MFGFEESNILKPRTALSEQSLFTAMKEKDAPCSQGAETLKFKQYFNALRKFTENSNEANMTVVYKTKLVCPIWDTNQVY